MTLSNEPLSEEEREAVINMAKRYVVQESIDIMDTLANDTNFYSSVEVRAIVHRANDILPMLRELLQHI